VCCWSDAVSVEGWYWENAELIEPVSNEPEMEMLFGRIPSLAGYRVFGSIPCVWEDTVCLGG